MLKRNFYLSAGVLKNSENLLESTPFKTSRRPTYFEKKSALFDTYEPNFHSTLKSNLIKIRTSLNTSKFLEILRSNKTQL